LHFIRLPPPAAGAASAAGIVGEGAGVGVFVSGFDSEDFDVSFFTESEKLNN